MSQANKAEDGGRSPATARKKNLSTADQLIRAGRNATEAVAHRDALIDKRHEEGASLRQIAAEAGLSHSAVAKILHKHLDT
ncbi:MAG: hypothetical protein FWC87_03675 [Acidimicrobiaceae bacterium]|nr:hypothetical protein [Acidimicrobiaceae bacterium]